MPRRKGHERLTVSIGVAEYRTGDRTGELISRADRALYQAKAAGRNHVSAYALTDA